jgi:hypothetical protein
MFPDVGFQIMSVIGPIFFIVIIGFILFIVIKGASQWSYNNKQPVLSVPATVKSKRSHTSHSSNAMNDNFNSSSSTSYYVTFEVESGDRMEFHVPGSEYGLLAEDDFGKLTFQGARYHGFERKKQL